MTVNILFTSVGGELAPSAMLSLKRSQRYPGVGVFGVDAREDAIGRYLADGFDTVPFGRDPTYVPTLLEICKRRAISLLVPWSDEEALACAAAREQFLTVGTTVACASLEALNVFSSKAKTYSHLARLGLPVPAWREVSDYEALMCEVESMLREYDEVVVKPSASRGGRNVSIVGKHVADANHESFSLQAFAKVAVGIYNDFFPLVVMERLKEPVFDLDILAKDGQVIRSVVRRRLRHECPNAGHVIEVESPISEFAKPLAKGFSLSWLYDCDLMLSADGSPKFIEINPRPSGSAAISIAAGVPLFEDMISLLKGEASPVVTSPGGKIIRPYTTLVVDGENSCT